MAGNRFSWQLRAFCAAGFALFFSCTPDSTFAPPCGTVDCTASIELNYPVDSNGYKIVELYYDTFGKAYFTVDINATPTDEYYWYNDQPVVSAELSGNLEYYIRNSLVNVVPTTDVYMKKTGAMMVTRQILGSRTELIGDTLRLNVEVVWDAGEFTVTRKYFENLILK